MKKQLFVSPLSILMVVLVSGLFYSVASADLFGGSIPKIPPLAICGDGAVGGTEECDDGNTVDGDGCSSTCEIENSSPQLPGGGLNLNISSLISNRYNDLINWAPEAEVGFTNNENDSLSFANDYSQFQNICFDPPCDNPPVSNVIPSFSGLKLNGYLYPMLSSFVESDSLAILGNLVIKGSKTISAGPENSPDPVIVDDDLEVTGAVRADEFGKFYDWDALKATQSYDKTYSFSAVTGPNKIFQTVCDTGDIAIQCGGYMCPDSTEDKYLGSYTYGSLCEILVYDGGGSTYATDASGNNTTIGCGNAGSAIVDVTCFSPDGGYSKTL